MGIDKQAGRSVDMLMFLSVYLVRTTCLCVCVCARMHLTHIKVCTYTKSQYHCKHRFTKLSCIGTGQVAS